MSRFVHALVAGAAVVAAGGSTVRADWYGGDPAANTAVPLAAFAWATGEPSPGYVGLAFDNFAWTNASGGMVDTIGGFYISAIGVPLAGVNHAEWEIRSGVSAGSGGTLVASGSGVPIMSSTAFSTLITGYALPDPVVRVELDVADFVLAPGNYWLGLSVGDVGAGVQGFVAETIGAGGIGGSINDGGTFYFQGDGTGNPWNYVDATAQWGSPVDMAYFITEVPSPSGVGVIALGALVSPRRRRR